MISYNTKTWFNSLFLLKKSDTLWKLFPLIIFVSLYTGLIVYLETEYYHLNSSAPIRNFGLLHTLLGFVISMLLVFRTNTAYDRWWEGRKQWGALTNCSRNFVIKINAYLTDKHDKDFFKEIIPIFTETLYKHLRKETTRLELDTKPHPEIPDFDKTKHLPNQVIVAVTNKIAEMYNEGKLSDAQLITLNVDLQEFLNICGACERIKNTPIPYSYSEFIKKFIFLYVITLPIGMSFNLGYMSIPIVDFIFYILASLELIAEEIEDPFGDDPNDLPIDIMSNKIEQNIDNIL